jgi:hypothetical protein
MKNHREIVLSVFIIVSLKIEFKEQYLSMNHDAVLTVIMSVLRTFRSYYDNKIRNRVTDLPAG